MNSEPPFETALQLALPGASHKAARALFGNRVSRSGLQHWRRGRASPPQWAVDVLRGILARQVAELEELAEKLRHIETANNREAGAAALRRWRAKRAKEKAGIEAGLSDDWKRTRDQIG